MRLHSIFFSFCSDNSLYLIEMFHSGKLPAFPAGKLIVRSFLRKFTLSAHWSGRNRAQGPVSRKSRELFGPEKPLVKLQLAYSEKLVFLYVVKGIKIKITAKFRASIRLRFEDTKRIMSPEIRPKSFGTLEKQAPGWTLYCMILTIWRETLLRVIGVKRSTKGCCPTWHMKFGICKEEECSRFAHLLQFIAY